MLPPRSPSLNEYQWQELGSRFVWDERVRQYINPDTHKFVSRAAVKTEINQTMDALARESDALANQIRARTISLADFQAQLAEITKDAHTIGAAAARGGWGQMTQGDYDAVSRRVERQLEYLDNFARQMEDPNFPLDGRINNRAKQYAKSGATGYDGADRAAAVAGGATHVKRVRNFEDSCPDCVAYEEEGWVEVEDGHAIGDSVCGSSCKCDNVYFTPSYPDEEPHD